MNALRFLLVAAALALGAASAAADDGQRRVALVIGNGAYTAVPRLPNPASDAAAIGKALTDVGFTKVTVVTDLTHQGLFDALRQFSNDSATADWSVLYYAGHGIEVDGKNYLVPVDAHLTFDRDVEFEGVSMQTVLAAVGGARQLRLVILDACRDDPCLTKMRQTVGTRSIARGLARVDPQGDLYVVYSAKSGQVALDGDGGRSPFVAALLKNIETPGLEVNLLFRKVHSDVERATNGQQEPAFEGTLPGEELYFKPAPAAPDERRETATAPVNPPVAAAPPPPAPAPGQDRLLAIEAKPETAGAPPAQPAANPPEPVETAKLEQPPPTEPAPAPADGTATAIAVQNALRRAGCAPGPANGEWTVRSRMALLEFSQHANLTLDVDKPDDAALQALRSHDGIVCPPAIGAAPKRASPPKRASLEPEPPRHVAAPRRPAPPRVVQQVPPRAYERPVVHRPVAARPSAPSCFMFNGERVCE